MKKNYILFAFVLMATFANAQINITFNVDLSNEPVVDDTIQLVGDIQGDDANASVSDWTLAGHMLTDADNDLIYTITLNVPAGDYEYRFINGGDWSLQENAGLDTTCAVLNGFGEYTRVITVTADATVGYVYNSCQTLTSTSYVSQISSTMEISPNPLNGEGRITIENADNEELSMMITNISGQVVRTIQNVQDDVVYLNSNELEAGFYFVTLTNEEGAKLTKKLVVTH